MKRRSLIVVFLTCTFCLNCVAQGKKAIADTLLIKLIAYQFKCVDTCYADSTKVLLLNALGWEISDQKPDTAILLFNQALKIAQKLHWHFGIAQANNNLASVLQIRGDNIGAMKRAFASISTWQELVQKQKESRRNLEGLASSMGNLATIYNKTGSFKEALSIFFRINEIFRKLGQKNKEGITLGNIAITYLRLNEFEKSIEYSEACLTLMEKLKDDLGVVRPLTNLGIAFKELKNYDQSLTCLVKALEILKRGNYQLYVAKLMSNISNTYQHIPDYGKALDFAYQALEIDSSIKNIEGIAIRRISLGSIYLDMGQYQKAEDELEKGLAVGLKINNQEIEINAYQYLNKVYEKTGQYQKALFYYRKEKTLEDSIFNYRKMQDITRIEANNEFTKSQDSAKAAQEKQLTILEADKRIALEELDKKRLLEVAQEQYHVLEADNKRVLAEAEKEKITIETEQKLALLDADKKRSIVESNAKEALARLETAKERTFRNFIILIASLAGIAGILIFNFYKRKRDAEQKENEAALSLQVSETEMKALRSQMNPHFIFNALQSIQTFLISHKPDEANTYLLKFSKLMRLVLENSQHSEVPIKDDMQALELYMQLESIRLTHPFTYNITIDDHIDQELTTIPPLILQPFVENAIWHGLQYKETAGHINIQIYKKANTLFAAVEDDGVGRSGSRKELQPIFIKKESMGMKLTTERLKILNERKKADARFTIVDLFSTNNRPTGTKVELFLPLAP
jgi:tetratricopeptide (TPR) repeat protein